jgi:hypothetical protein
MKARCACPRLEEEPHECQPAFRCTEVVVRKAQVASIVKSAQMEPVIDQG